MLCVSLLHCIAHRSEIPAEQRLLARQAILQISTVPRASFLAIDSESYCISREDWSFEAYHGAAAAAVQEDKGLNRMIYCVVPRCAARGVSRAAMSVSTRPDTRPRQETGGERILATGEHRTPRT